MPFGFSDKTYTLILDTFSANSAIESAILFGSRAKGNAKPGSDIDIALKGQRLTFNDIIKLQNIFDEIDQVYIFDLIIYEHISEPALAAHIDRVGIEIYKK